MPLHVLDIHADGTASPAPDTAPEGPGVYRWFHFDLADPILGPWAEAHLPELAAAALVESETRPRSDVLGDGLILNLRAVNLNPGEAADQMASIRLWVTRGLIVTVRRRRVFSLDLIRDAAAAGDAPRTTGAFLAELVANLGKRIRDEVLRIEAELEDLELRLEEEDADSGDLKGPRKRVIRFLRYMHPQRDALLGLIEGDIPPVEEDARLELRESTNQFLLATEALEAQKARLEALTDHAHALLTEQLARNGYTLSLVAAVFLPLSFLTGLFGVNLGGIPGMNHPAAFSLLSLSLAVIGVAAIVMLRWKRMI